VKQLLSSIREWFRGAFTFAEGEPAAEGTESFFDVAPRDLFTGRAGNGKVILPHPYQSGPLVLHGGPYRSKPHELLGVRLEMSAPADDTMVVDFPIVDFGVPDYEDLVTAVHKAYERALGARELYIGCTGGFGRTGLFMTCLMARVMFENGFPFPDAKAAVTYLRALYVPNAVETADQMDMVERYISDLNAA